MTETKDIKITRTKEVSYKHVTTKFFANGIFVCETEKGRDAYCTISRGGTPSNIRDHYKNTYTTRWNHDGLRQFLGKESFTEDEYKYFKNDYPDTKWGYQGSLITGKKIKELLERFKSKQKT